MSDVWAVLSWWLIIQALGLAVWPLALRLFRWLPDRGYTLAKPLGLLVVSYIFWLLVSLRLLPNTVVSVIIVAGIVASGSAWLYRRENTLLRAWLREHRWLVISYELLFAIAFIGWAIFRAHAPDVVTGEKPMELAFLNAINRSATFPPPDPWLSGFNIAYYYFGYVTLSLLQRLSGVGPGVAFSLGNALWFALCAAGAFGVAANLVLLTKRSTRRAAAFTGVLAAIFSVLLGNFEAPLEVLYSAGQGSPELWQQLDILDLNQPPPQHEAFPWPLRNDPGWWYRAAWLIHDYPPDSVSPQLAQVTGRPRAPNTTFQPTITEFPQFSFVLGDLHPHLLDLPFVLLSIALAVNLFLAGASGEVRAIYRVPLWGLYALLLGGLGFMNTWDFPVYTTLAIVALGLGRWLSHAAKSIWKEMRDRAIDLLLIGGLGFVLYLPFYRSFTAQVAGLWPNVFNGTRVVQFFILFGPFIVIGLLFGLYQLRQQRLRRATLAKGHHWRNIGVDWGECDRCSIDRRSILSGVACAARVVRWSADRHESAGHHADCPAAGPRDRSVGSAGAGAGAEHDRAAVGGGAPRPTARRSCPAEESCAALVRCGLAAGAGRRVGIHRRCVLHTQKHHVQARLSSVDFVERRFGVCGVLSGVRCFTRLALDHRHCRRRIDRIGIDLSRPGNRHACVRFHGCYTNPGRPTSRGAVPTLSQCR